MGRGQSFELLEQVRMNLAVTVLRDIKWTLFDVDLVIRCDAERV